MSSSNTSNLGYPRLGDRSSRHNQMTVVVEQKMVKVPMTIVKNPQSKEPACGPSLCKANLFILLQSEVYMYLFLPITIQKTKDVFCSWNS